MKRLDEMASNKNGIARCLVAILLCSGVAAEWKSSHAEESKLIKLGYISDLSGTGAFFGVQSTRGARLAQWDLARDQRPIEIIFEDSGGKPPNAVSAAMKLLSVDKVDAVICDLTPVCSAISPQVRAAGKVLIYHSPVVSIRKANPLAFRNFIDYRAACKKLAKFWVDRKISKVGSLMPNLEFADQCLAGLNEVLPGHFTYRYNPGDDLRTASLLFRSKEIQALAHVGYENDFLGWFKASNEQNFRPIQGFVEIMLSQEFIKTGHAAINGASVMGYEDLPTDFEARLDKNAPSHENINIQGAALAYNAVFNLALALSACETRESACVVSELKNSPHVALLGFKGFGISVEEYVVVLKELKNGKLSAASQGHLKTLQ